MHLIFDGVVLYAMLDFHTMIRWSWYLYLLSYSCSRDVLHLAFFIQRALSHWCFQIGPWTSIKQMVWRCWNRALRCFSQVYTQMLVSPRCLPWLPLRQLSPPTSVLEVLQHSTCNSCLGCRSKVERWISWSIFSEIVNDRSWNGYSMPTKTHQPTNPLRGFSRTTTAGSWAAQQVIRRFWRGVP